jgi:hypothetical protein
VKYFLLFFGGKSVAFRGRPASNEGRIMIVILRETGCGGRDGVVMCSRMWTNDAIRTAKSCGPDAPLLASSA